jgi:hypothetical protein
MEIFHAVDERQDFQRFVDIGQAWGSSPLDGILEETRDVPECLES